MFWVLLVIELLPAVFKIIASIRDLIQKLPKADRTAATRKLRAICRQNVRKTRGKDTYKVRTSEQTVVEELMALHDELKGKVA